MLAQLPVSPIWPASSPTLILFNDRKKRNFNQSSIRRFDIENSDANILIRNLKREQIMLERMMVMLENKVSVAF